MKRILLGALAVAAIVTAAYALQPTPTPPIAPETGEESGAAASVVNVARLKLGQGALSLTVASSAASGTLNNASGVITLASATAGASGATPTTVTLTNSKAQAGDLIFCDVDQTGAPAAAVVLCNSHIQAVGGGAGGGQIVFTIQSATPTALTATTITLYYLVVTKGNPN